jgi:hypothetical protein
VACCMLRQLGCQTVEAPIFKTIIPPMSQVCTYWICNTGSASAGARACIWSWSLDLGIKHGCAFRYFSEYDLARPLIWPRVGS